MTPTKLIESFREYYTAKRTRELAAAIRRAAYLLDRYEQAQSEAGAREHILRIREIVQDSPEKYMISAQRAARTTAAHDEQRMITIHRRQFIQDVLASKEGSNRVARMILAAARGEVAEK